MMTEMPNARIEVARQALAEITPASTFGELVSETEADGVVTLEFAATMLGYPGWHWTVSVAELDGEAPTVLEAELLPGDGALLAPDWLPWSDRLEEYKASRAAEGESDDDGDESDDDDNAEDPDAELDDLDDDESDDDDDDDDDRDEDDDVDDPLDEDDAYDGVDIDAAGLDAEALDAESLAAESGGVDESDESEGESDDGGPEPEAATALEERLQEDQ